MSHMKALTELAAFLYSHRLDRSRPLWEIWFIEGLQDGRFGLLQKLHHCMMDGQAVGGQQVAATGIHDGALPLGGQRAVGQRDGQ